MLTQKEQELLEKYQVWEKIDVVFTEFVLSIVSIFDGCAGQDFEELLEDEFLEEHPEVVNGDVSVEEYHKLLEEFGKQKASDIVEECLKDIKAARTNQDMDYWEKKIDIVKEKLKES